MMKQMIKRSNKFFNVAKNIDQVSEFVKRGMDLLHLEETDEYH